MSNHAHRRPKRQAAAVAVAPPSGTPDRTPEVVEVVEEIDTDALRFSGNAWRFFALDDDGTLVAPFVDRYWPGSIEDRTWQTETKRATCIDSDHDAPVEDCSCGIAGVKAWPAFLAAVTTGNFAGSPVPVIDECPVMAMVMLLGRAFPSKEANDPPTTFRAEVAVVQSIHLAPTVSADTAQAVADRYRKARCFTHPAETWPRRVTEHAERVWATATADDVARFDAAVRKAGFGHLTRADLRGGAALRLGQSAVAALRDGATVEDLASVLFDSPAKPTFGQAEALVLAAAEHLSPGLYAQNRGYRHARPIRVFENLARPGEQMAERVRIQ